MKIYPLRYLLKRSVLMSAMMAVSGPGFGQYAMNVRKDLKSVQRFETGQTGPVSLKETLEKITADYHVEFAYEKGLLENKTIPLSSAQNPEAGEPIETVLKRCLETLPLDFKKINDKQYSIFLIEKTAVKEARTVQGRVVDENAVPVIGASVYLKSNPQNGTTTDADGKFKLSVPDAGEVFLVVGYVGYEKTEAAISDLSKAVTIKLKPSSNALNEVVVTALGIKKERKSLGYAVSEVQGTELTQARENNVANALTGKIPGVNVAGLSTGPGGSSRVVIRGNTSLSGDNGNQPLYVINGMPMDNSVPGGEPTINGITSNVDKGDGIAALNPDDIESMTVLKGGQAAALYGSRASNGVILITTKKGRMQKGVGIEFSSIAQFDNVAVVPDYQYEYGQGDGGVKPTTLTAAQTTGRRSFGAKIDGSTDYVAVDGLTHPYVAAKDNVRNFYQTGATYTNTLAFVGGGENLTYRFSAADLNSKGILPKTTYDRKTFNLSLNGRLSKMFSIDAFGQYNLEKGRNRTGAGDALGNPNWTPLEIANTADVRWLAPGFDANGNEQVWNDAAIASNGYFVINKFQEKDTKNRFIGQASVTFTPITNLVFKGTVSRDYYNYNYSNILPTGTLYSFNGEYSGQNVETSETNALLTGSYSKSVFNDLNITLLAGANQRRSISDGINITGRNFNTPYVYNISNLGIITNLPTSSRINTNSVFGSLDLNYKSLAFLSITGRNDWFSNLSPQNNSIFYPSIGGSFVLSDAVKMPSFINLAKLRGSYARVGGNGPDAYAINLTYSGVTSSGLPLQNVTSTNLNNPNLKPYINDTYEGGVELQFFKNRLGLDVTYYSKQTKDDIVRVAISNTSGYNTALLNLGALSNKGIEALVNGVPVKGKNFTWSTSYNMAYNKSLVKSLGQGITNINLAATVGNWANFNQVVGLPYGQIVGTKISKDASGNIIYNTNTGVPVPTAYQPLGNSVAPLTMGFTNDFKYKNFSLNVLLDGKFGNKVFSIMEVYATRLGLMKSTLPGRENGLVLNGVTQTGAPYTRTVPVSGLRPYYNEFRNYSELFLHDGSFIKLRQVILSYNLPSSFINKIKLQSASISFVARNLAILYKKTDNFDPEQSFTSSTAQGFESIGLPRTRNMGVSLNVKF